MPSTSIVIPHYRTPRHLDLCLACIEHFTRSAHEIIVADNGSEPSCLERLRQRSGIVLLERRQEGEMGHRAHAEALDLGISRARGDFVVTLHSDTFVRRAGWLEFLVDRLESGPYEIVGPGTQHVRPLSPWERLRESLGGTKRMKRVGPVFTIYRRQVLERARFTDFEKVWQLAEPYRKQGLAHLLTRREASLWALHVGGSTKLEILRHRRTAMALKERQLMKFLQQPEIRDLFDTGDPARLQNP
jgi:glycosyltransferase involved in cell wall biosynthesis